MNKHVIKTDVIVEYENSAYLIESDISFDGHRRYFVYVKLDHGYNCHVGNYDSLEEAKKHVELMS